MRLMQKPAWSKGEWLALLLHAGLQHKKSHQSEIRYSSNQLIKKILFSTRKFASVKFTLYLKISCII